MGAVPQLEGVDELPAAPASDFKKIGWRRILRQVDANGRLVVTNHKTPEAVILSLGEYQAILRELERARAQASPVEELRQRFKARVAAVGEAERNAGNREVFAEPLPLDGAVRAGDHY